MSCEESLLACREHTVELAAMLEAERATVRDRGDEIKRLRHMLLARESDLEDLASRIKALTDELDWTRGELADAQRARDRSWP